MMYFKATRFVHRIGSRGARKGILHIAPASASGFIPLVTSGEWPGADAKVPYEDQLPPTFRQRGSACHSPTAKKADFDVTSYSSLMHGSSSGAVIEPGDADASQLFLLVTNQSEPK